MYVCYLYHINRHVILPKELARNLQKNKLMDEKEWRGIGVQQSRGWAHYAIHRYASLSPSLSLSIYIYHAHYHHRYHHKNNSYFTHTQRSPEPHILLFRRPLGTDPTTGKINPEMQRKAKERYMREYVLNKAE